MKYEYRYCSIFLLVNALAGFLSVSGAGVISKFICPGDSVQAFQNITFNNCSSVVSLYTNGERHTLIARWSFRNCSRNETFLPDFKERVFLYGNGTITIHDIHPWDQAKYIVNHQMGDISIQHEVQINIMAAPAKDCRPKILHLGNSLFASLKAIFCGKPVATLYWKGYGDVSNTSEPVLKLTPGNEAVTYYACIKGPALQCGRNSTPLDYCSSFTIGGDISPPVLSQTWDVKTAIFIVVGIVVCVLLILVIAVILGRKRCRKRMKGAVVICGGSGNVQVNIGKNQKRTVGGEIRDRDYDPGSSRSITRPEDHSDNLHEEQSIPLLSMSQPRQTHDEHVSGKQTVPLEENPELWTKHFDSLKWEDIKERLNDEQQQGLKNYCDNLQTREEPVNDDQNQVNELYSDTLTKCEKSANDEQQQVLRSYTDNLQKVEKPVNDDQHQVNELYSGMHHPENKTEDESIENPTCTGPEKVTELIESHDDALCTICFANRNGVILVPCGHTTTCVKCGMSLQRCPVCNAQITNLVKPYSTKVSSAP